jgi:hypothetical protein
VTLGGPLSQLLSHDHRLVTEYHGQHTFPPPPEISVESFLSEFERTHVDLNEPRQCEGIRAFTAAFGNIFAAHVALTLLYESELHSAEIIKANPLRNTPGMFVLRFLYFLPTLMKAEATHTSSAIDFQEKLKLLISFATERREFYFVCPVSPSPAKPVVTVKPETATPRVILLVGKS